MEATLSSFWKLAEAFSSDARAHQQLNGEADQQTTTPLHSRSVNLEHYVATLRVPNTWLALVEERIRDSINPDDGDEFDSCEWLSREAGFQALEFFRNSYDLLPNEPHIYGTKDGDLVAEYETEKVRVTSVVGERSTILFGYRSDLDEPPSEIEIRRGSNHLRVDVRRFIEQLGVSKDGKTLAAKA